MKRYKMTAFLLSLLLVMGQFVPFTNNSNQDGENSLEVRAEERELEETNEEVETWNFGTRISFANYSGVQYESLAKQDALYKDVIGAVITITNQETGQIFTYTTDETGSHQLVPQGKYLMELKSVPDDILGRFEWPEAKTIEVKRFSSFDGFNVVESKKKDSEVYKPEVKEIEVAQYDKLNIEDGIANLKELPEGTEVQDITPEGKLNTNIPGKYTRTVKVTYPDKTSEEVEVTVFVTTWFGARISFRNLPGNEYECLEKTEKPWKSVTGAVITITNQETGEVYTYTTDETGSHQYVKAGKYLMELVSVPDELKGKFEWPAAKEIEISGSSFNGFNVEEIKVEAEVTPTPTPQPDKPGKDEESEKIRLTFKTNEGTWADGSKEDKILVVDKFSFVNIIDAPVREGYEFLYWKGSKYQPGDKYLAFEDHTFVAQWKKVAKAGSETTPEAPSQSEKPAESSKTNGSQTAKTGDASYIAMTVGVVSLAVAAALVMNRKKDEK